MPKLKDKPPKLCKDRNQAYSCHNGKRIYHGRWKSAEAQKSYNRFKAAWEESPDLPLLSNETGDTLVSELAAGYLGYAEPRLDKTEFQHFGRAVGYLIELYGDFTVNEFSPKKLKTCRSRMVKTGTQCRSYINKQIGRIIRIFAWGVEEEYVKPNIVAALREVKNLQRGEPGTFDNPPRQDVSDEVVKRTLPFMSPTIAAMVQLQRITGMRPSEVYRMTVGDIDKSKEQDGLWHYVLKTHKTEKRVGGGKIVPLGKPEQTLIASYLVGKTAAESVFSPRQAVQERRERQRAERKTKVSPSQQERNRQRAKHPAENLGDFYDKNSYRKAVEYAIEKGNKNLSGSERIPNWTPYQLRHAAGTAVEKAEGLDKAQALLGHRTANMTKRYAHAELAINESLALKRVNPFEDKE